MTAVRLCCLLAATLLCARLCIAEEEPAKPKEFTPDEVAAAEKTISTLTPEQQQCINNLRFLLTPGYETELMAGRRYRPCILEPFETIPATPMTLLEALRLWAVLRSGMPSTPAIEKQFARFLAMPAPAHPLAPTQPLRDSLAPYAVQMALCVAAAQRPELGSIDKLKEKAQALMDVAMEIRDLIDDKSPYIVERAIDPKWFANHLWRGVTCRCAIALGLTFKDKVWEKDLRNLANAWEKKHGWVYSKSGDLTVDQDLCTNFMALAALGLATNAPSGSVEDALLGTLQRRYEDEAAILAELETRYPFDRIEGALLACAIEFAPTVAPGAKSAPAWRQAYLRTACTYEPTGAVKPQRMVTVNMDLAAGRYERVVAETVLSVLGVSGGFVSGTGPLAKLGLATIGRAMHAYTVLHASNLPADSDGFDGLDPAAEDAIRLGCEYLESIQENDGKFPGINERYAGNTALAMLAVLHGGWERDSGPIRKGLDWLLTYDPGKVKGGGEVAGVGYGNTYSDAITLMFLQKYYEPEQIEHGVFWCDTKGDFEKASRAVWNKIEPKHRELIDKLVKNIDESHVEGEQGGFGYYPHGARNPGMAGNLAGYSDNSCSQYAILGYKAASLLGAKLNIENFEHEAKRLVEQYYPVETMAEVEFVRNEDDKKTGKDWKSKIHPGGWGYGCAKGPPSLQMTAAGISSLVVCQDELKLRNELDLELDRNIELTIHGAQTWMATAYYEGGENSTMGLLLEAGGMDGWSIFYNLYSVERACVLAGLETLGKDIEWYDIGATALIEYQNPDGSWGPEKQTTPQTVNICLAILFLKKASLPVITDPQRRQPVKNPVTGPEPDKAKDPVTGKEGGKKEPDPAK